jgi:hypothetical protein
MNREPRRSARMTEQQTVFYSMTLGQTRRETTSSHWPLLMRQSRDQQAIVKSKQEQTHRKDAVRQQQKEGTILDSVRIKRYYSSIQINAFVVCITQAYQGRKKKNHHWVVITMHRKAVHTCENSQPAQAHLPPPQIRHIVNTIEMTRFPNTLHCRSRENMDNRSSRI